MWANLLADYTKELPESWKTKEVEAWKEKAKTTLKHYYIAFGGRQWDEYDMAKERLLLRAKICYAMYGPPTKMVEDIEMAYDEDENKKADKIIDQILKERGSTPESALKVGIIFISCKQEKSEFTLPLFSVCAGTGEKERDIRWYVDNQGRSYKSWDDWIKNNTLPMMKYCYPSQGYFTCQDYTYCFNPEKEPCLSFGSSPQCDTGSRILRQTDVVTGITSLGLSIRENIIIQEQALKLPLGGSPVDEAGMSCEASLQSAAVPCIQTAAADCISNVSQLLSAYRASGIVCAASLFTPIGPAVVLTSAVAGGCSAAYGTGRAIHRLVDKGQHGEDLADLESLTLWFSIAATPLHFSASFVNASLVRGATANGRIFSSSMRTFATIINFTTLGVDGVMLGFGLANMIEKKKNKQLTPLDVLQFSMSVFFFTNTLIQPKVASTIIERAQDQHMQRYADVMSDADAKASFQKFVDQNKGQGTITDKSKIIRTINRIEDPNGFFKGVGLEADIKIGGRKGKTVLVTQQVGDGKVTTRIKPNSVLFTDSTKGAVNFTRDLTKVQRCLGKDLNDVELNGEKIFQNLNNRQKGRVGRVFGGSAGYDKNIVDTAFDVAQSMGYSTADDFMSMIEIVAAKVKGKNGADLASTLGHIRGPGKGEFVTKINADITIATYLASKADLNFSDPLVAVYHYRKHGAEFPQKIPGNKINFYLGEVPGKLTQDANLRQIQKLQDGTIRKVYTTNQDQFAVITEIPGPQGKRTLSTMFKYPGCSDRFAAELAKIHENAVRLEPLNVAADNLAHAMGFRAMHVYLTINGNKVPVEECVGLESEVQEEMRRVLCAFLHEDD